MENSNAQKACNKCGEQKELTEYYYNKTRYSSKCKVCHRDVMKKHYKDKPEQYKTYIKANYEANRDNYYKRTQASYKERYNNDPEFREAEKTRKRIKYHLDKYLKDGTDRFMVELECNVSSYAKHITSKFEEGMTWDDRKTFDIDHIIPISKGGTFSYTNVQPLTPKENRLKGDNLNWKKNINGGKL
jgi:5-methylcytosine-specific restriction endonuclease McrA